MDKMIKFVTSKLTAQQNHNIANGLMIAGVLINLWDIMQNGFEMKLVPILLAVFLVGIGYAYQLLFVRCSHCGDKLKGMKNKMKLPERCPECGKRLNMLPKKTTEE